MNLSLWSVARAWRRACRSPRLARVISFSTSGLTALAFAWLVLIRSCSISCLDRFERSASRCAASRLSLLRFLRCRIGPLRSSRRSVLLEVEAPRVQGLDHFLDRFLAEVGDRVQLRARLAHQVADRLHPGPLEAVVGAHAELELLDQDLVEPVGAGAAVAGRCARKRVRRHRRYRLARGQLLDALGVGED